MSTARAAAWLRAWDSQGDHRTGTAGDAAGAEWLAGEVRALGARVQFEEFRLRRIDPIAAWLELDGRRIEAVPVFDAPATDARGVTGSLGPVGSEAAIGVAELSPQAVYTGEYRRLRSEGVHRGLVIVCKGAAPGMGLLNAEQFRAPYGCPAIHVASEHRDAVLAAKSARLVSHYQCSDALACNAVVEVAGRSGSRPPLVVMTPRSSWWQSTAERGGGLVCWLETLRALLAEPPATDVVMTANSGHELGHLGLDDFMARRPGWDGPDGACWIHYGANLSAAGGTLSVVSTSDDMRALAAAELAPDVMAPKSLVPSGETRDIHRAGGRYLTLVGTNPLFHLPQDRWPHAVDVAAVARIAGAAVRIVRRLAG